MAKGVGIILFKQMKYFVSVVECDSFTEAAEQNYISQSAISQQIRALEQDLHVQLIRRENRRFSLTPAGEYFYRHARELLGQVAELERETTRIGQTDQSLLRIGYLRCYGVQELYGAMAEFSRLYPETTIQLVSGTHEELYAQLILCDVDMALSDQRRAFFSDYINYHLLYGKCYAELSARSGYADRDAVSVDDLRRIPCILISSDDQQDVEREYYQNALGFGGNFLFARDLEEGRLMVAGNQGFLPVEGVGTLPMPDPSICRIPLLRGEHRIQRNFCAFWKKERNNQYLEGFADILKKLLNPDHDNKL